MKEKPCKICGKMFIPHCPSNLICSEDHYTKCPVCGKEMLWNSTRAAIPCSKECRKELTKQKNIAKYGVEHPMQCKEVQEHHKKAMLDKYGVESPLQCEDIRNKAIESNRRKFGTDWALGNKEIKEKSKATMIKRYGAATTLESSILRKKVEATCLEKYGVPYVTMAEEVKNKISNSNFLKYGFTSAMSNPDVYNKMKESRITNNGSYWTPEMEAAAKQTSLDHYGVDNPSKSPEIQAKIKDVMIDKYGENYGTYITRNVSHNVISNINKAFMSKLNERGIEGEFEFSGGTKYKYDIALPEQKVVIEINPTYTHNAIGNHWTDKGLPNDYHRNKTNAAKEIGFHCINVFDWDDWNKVIDIVIPRQTVYARKCQIYKLQPKVADEFLNNYHLQGTVKGQVLCLGLVKDNELLQVMTFGKPRYNNKYYSELLRLCTKPGISLVGGASKLFKFATESLGLDEIISYCDLSKFTGDVYEKIRMKHLYDTDPQEIWSKDDRKITANLLRQRGFDQLFGTDYGKGTSNTELMLHDGWLPVFDCGQAVYAYSSAD